ESPPTNHATRRRAAGSPPTRERSLSRTRPVLLDRWESAAVQVRPRAAAPAPSPAGDDRMRTLPKAAAALASTGVLLLAVARGQQGAQPSPAAAPMKFNDVREVAPGVFFRYSAISATDPGVVFGGCNNVWVVFKDYVAVIDANFPKEAGDVLEAIKKTT